MNPSHKEGQWAILSLYIYIRSLLVLGVFGATLSHLQSWWTNRRHRIEKGWCVQKVYENGSPNSFPTQPTKHLSPLDSLGYSLGLTIHPGGTTVLISCVKLHQLDLLTLRPKIVAEGGKIKCECLDAPRTARMEEAVYVPHNDVFSSFLSRWVQMCLGFL